jgi:hypothetical protein
MLERLMSAALVTAAACAVMFCGTPEPKAEATPTVAKAAPVGPPPDQSIGTSRCDCSGPKDCVCDNCKCLACKIPKAVAPRHRTLSSEEILVLYFTHQAAIEAASEGSDASMRTHVESWLTTNPKHDPRSPEYVATPIPELPPPGDVAHVKSAPLYTHPQPVAKPVTSPSHARHIAVTPRVQYVRQWRPNYGPLGRQLSSGQWVTVALAPRQYQRQQPVYRYRSCSNGSCR